MTETQTKFAPIPQLDLVAQYHSIKPEIDEAIARVLESGHFIMGPEVASFEQEAAEYCNVKHAIGVASGTDALLLSLRALDIGPDDIVITSTFTFGATASAICNTGATPYFVDINPSTFNIDVHLLKSELENNAELRQKAKAIIPVHLYGQMADMDPIMALAKEHNLLVVEDAAQSIGATYKGTQAGSIGDTGCFSFFPSKNLGAFGDAGMITTSNDDLAEKLRLLRAHGMRPKYIHHVVGSNSRLDALQAAILSVKLKHLDDWSTARQAKAASYNDLLKDVDGIQTPYVNPNCTHIYHQYTVKVENDQRDSLAEHLNQHNIGTAVYYPMPLHQQSCFDGRCSGTLAQGEAASTQTLSLPIYPELTAQNLQTVADAIRQHQPHS